MQCEFPTVNLDPDQIRELFQNVKTIAILGLSPNPEKDSHHVAKYLQEKGYTIYPVYPKEETILGQPVFRSLVDIPHKVDMVNVFRKPEALPAIVDAVLKRGDVQYLWTQLGIVHNEAAKRAQDQGVKVVQSYCAMVEHRKLFG